MAVRFAPQAPQRRNTSMFAGGLGRGRLQQAGGARQAHSSEKLRALPRHRSGWRQPAQENPADARYLCPVCATRVAGGALGGNGFQAQGNAADRIFGRGRVSIMTYLYSLAVRK